MEGPAGIELSNQPFNTNIRPCRIQPPFPLLSCVIMYTFSVAYQLSRASSCVASVHSMCVSFVSVGYCA